MPVEPPLPDVNINASSFPCSLIAHPVFNTRFYTIPQFDAVINVFFEHAPKKWVESGNVPCYKIS